MTKLAKLLYLLGLGLLLIAILPATATEGNAMTNPASSQNPLPYRTVEVNNMERATIAQLRAVGAVPLSPPELVDPTSWNLEYNLILWQVPVNAMNSLMSQHNLKFKVRDEYHSIYANGIEFYPVAGEPPIPTNLRQSKREGYQLWMLQFQYHQRTQVQEWLYAHNIPVVYDTGWVGFVVWVNDKQLTELEAQVNPNGPIVWTGPYHPYYRFEPTIRSYVDNLTVNSNRIIEVTVTFYKHPNITSSFQKLQNFAVGGVLVTSSLSFDPVYSVKRLKVFIRDLISIANFFDVILIYPYDNPVDLDEMQNQIVAGNLINGPSEVKPNGPGYLSWLSGKNFSQNPTDYPVVVVADSGVDNGSTNILHPDFKTLQGQSRVILAENCTKETSAKDTTGHGTLVAGIVGGYNNRNSFPYTDTLGYNRGLGVSPYGQLVNLRISAGGFFDASKCGGTYGKVLERIGNYNYNSIVANFSSGSSQASYSVNSRDFDIFSRNISSGSSKALLSVIAAGNSGLAGVIEPSTAKNVLTIGSAMSTREPTIEDGCGYFGSSNADDVSIESSRGPTSDGRAKPDLVAPGVHIQGPASQIQEFDGSGVCGNVGNRAEPQVLLSKFYPANQTLYTWANGTSFAASAVAGAAQLLYNYYRRTWGVAQDPSPALAKAFLINSARFLETGNARQDDLPSPSQGWGMVNLGTLFNYAPNNTYVLDQSVVFNKTNTNPFQIYGQVKDLQQPVKFTLVWTDPAGQEACGNAGRGKCLINDLDLLVAMPGNRTYRGNNFNGQYSITGGSPDVVNNVENIYIAPSSDNSSFVVEVRPRTLNGTINSELRSQDFALVINNVTNIVPTGQPTTFAPPIVEVSTGLGGNGNGVIDPGELVRLKLGLQNTGSQDAVLVSSLLRLNSGQPKVTMVDERSDYPDIITSDTQKIQPIIVSV